MLECIILSLILIEVYLYISLVATRNLKLSRFFLKDETTFVKNDLYGLLFKVNALFVFGGVSLNDLENIQRRLCCPILYLFSKR